MEHTSGNGYDEQGHEETVLGLKLSMGVEISENSFCLSFRLSRLL